MQQHLVFDVLVVSQIISLLVIAINSKGHALDAYGAYNLVMGCVWILGAFVLAIANDSQGVIDWMPFYAFGFAVANFISATIVKVVLDTFSQPQ